MKCTYIFVLCLLVLALPALAQQQEVNRIDVFTGYSYLRTPSIGLSQNGFNGSFGVNANRWLGLGADFSILTGSTSILVGDTKLAGTVPAALNGLGVPTDATTYTFAAGPQLNLRKWEKITLFARPGLGLFHHKATLAPATLAGLAQLGVVVPGLTSQMSDTVPFYGAGGGVDVEASKRFGFRFSVDLVHANPFNNILKSQNEVRLSIGPRLKFGTLK